MIMTVGLHSAQGQDFRAMVIDGNLDVLVRVFP